MNDVSQYLLNDLKNGRSALESAGQLQEQIKDDDPTGLIIALCEAFRVAFDMGALSKHEELHSERSARQKEAKSHAKHVQELHQGYKKQLSSQIEASEAARCALIRQAMEADSKRLKPIAFFVRSDFEGRGEDVYTSEEEAREQVTKRLLKGGTRRVQVLALLAAAHVSWTPEP